jgi:cell division protein FtsI/penicillin-binding protein 2
MIDEQSKTNSQRRLTLLAFCLTFGFSVIAAQLFRYQVLLHSSLEEEALEVRTRERVVPSRRGYIADRNGHILAADIVRWSVEVSPPLVVSSTQVVDYLSELLALPREQVYDKVTADEPWVQIAKRVDQETGEAIATRAFPGITCLPEPLRIYPENRLFSHLLGIVNDTGDGFYGVEGYYNPMLNGMDGKIAFEQDPAGNELPRPPLFESPAQDGVSLVLTVDRNIQLIAREQLIHALNEYGAQSGTVIIMDPKTGGILASVSYPAYNPNDFAGEDLRLLADPSVSSMWEPGSIFKIITWGAGLDSGTISPGTTFYDDGALEVGGRVIRNWDRQGHGLVTMNEGLIESLNTVAAFISTSTGKDRFYTYLRRFGFGQLSEVDLASEGPGMMKLPGDPNWFPSELGTNSFGQGIAVTPLQMLTAVAAVANEGVLMKPHIVNELVTDDPNGEGLVVTQVKPLSVRRPISKETAQTLSNMLVAVVEHGAEKAQVPGYRIAGKTGTAQIPTPYGYHPSDTIASFIGYAPADNPQFIVLVKLDKPSASPWGSQTAAPTFAAIAERLFLYMQIPPDDIRLAQGP